ncbi:outer membrane beta-barrel protein [Novosphingobium soli]|uniref:Outer membrane beta-barrel protein n=1 Tax=Novosphingobium soli TaxID=574956 RepID=A0ABV6CWJ1_9SPHN
MTSRANRYLLRSLPLATCLTWAGAAHAQTVSTIIDPVVPVDFDRGRNTSVAREVDPHFRPVGVRMGGFQVYPSIMLTSGATDNVYVNNSVKVSDAFFALQPQVQARSNWSRHSLSIDASADIYRYAHQTLRNREEYGVVAIGIAEVSSEIDIKGRINFDRRAESPFLNDLSADVSVLSQYSRFNPSLSVIYTGGHTRLTATAERYTFRFSSASNPDGSIRDQAERDRDINRAGVQADYAFTPSVAAYVQVNGEHTNYLSPRADGSANRDGDTFRVMGGLSLDLAGLLRGNVAAGYTRKKYDAQRYSDVGGLTIDSSLELFVTPLTTVALVAKSTLQDINNNVVNGAYRDITFSADVSHALLRNLLIKGRVAHIRRSPVESGDRIGQAIVQTTLGAAYQADRYTILSVNLGYGRGRPRDNSGSVSFDEFRGLLSIQLRL